MANFKNKPAAGTYTVDTGHAYCPDHLYLIDEGSGATLEDKGAVGGLNITITDAVNMWGSGDLGGGNGAGGETTSPFVTTGSGDTGLSVTGLSASAGICLVAIMRSDNATNPSVRETVAAAGSSGSTTYYAQLSSSSASDGFLLARYGDAAGANTKVGAIDVWDASYHMVAARFVDNNPNVNMVVSHDGGAWTTTSSVASGNIDSNFNRIAIGKQAFATDNTDIFTGRVVSLFVYRDGSAATWDNAWIASVYNSGDPWQFLATSAPLWPQYRTHCNTLLRM